MELEAKKKMAYKWLNTQIKGWKLINQRLPFDVFGDIHNLSITNFREIHIAGVRKIADVLDISVIREDWDGNKCCNTNHDIVYFWYHNVKFFELISKMEDENEGQ